MDGIRTWTDALPDEVIELLVRQIFGEYFEYGAHDTLDIQNNLQYNYTEYVEHGSVWTWDEEE